MWKKETPIEIITEEKVDISFSKRDSKATRFKGRIIGDMQKARNDGNREMVEYLQELLIFFNTCYPDKIVKYEVRMVGGWKGRDSLSISGFKDDFILLEHRKDKNTGKVSTVRHNIPHENVNRLFFWIKQWKVGETHKCYDFAEKIGEIDWEEVWKKRTKVYFAKYYFPIKILESLKLIKYSGKGDITRIK